MIQPSLKTYSRMHFIGVLAAFFFLTTTSAFSQKSSLLWEISKGDTLEASYLFGTMHSADSSIFEKKSSILNYIEACDVFSGELDLNETPDPVAMSMRMMADAPLTSLYSDEDYEKVNSYLTEKLGEMAPIVTMFKPFWIMATIIQVEEVELNQSERDSSSAETQGTVIDDQLQRFAESESMEIRPLETMEEQMSAIDAISIEEQAQMLLEMAVEPVKNEDMMDGLKESYRNQNLDKMYELYQSESFSTDVERLLIDTRNQNMAERLATIIQEGKPVFCAIGALHLPGDEGVIERLRAMGYTVKAVKY